VVIEVAAGGRERALENRAAAPEGGGRRRRAGARGRARRPGRLDGDESGDAAVGQIFQGGRGTRRLAVVRVLRLELREAALLRFGAAGVLRVRLVAASAGVRISRLLRRLGELLALEEGTQQLRHALLLADAALRLGNRGLVDRVHQTVDTAVDGRLGRSGV